MPLPKPWALPKHRVLSENESKELLKGVINLVDLEVNGLDKLVNENIQKNRMTSARVEIYNKNGEEITDADVKFEQISHEFNFGCNAFLAGDLGSEEKNSEYENIFKNVFNQAVLPFYWKDDEPEKDKWRFEKDSKYIYRRPTAETMLEFCEKTNCRPKGHNLVWPSDLGVPTWMNDNPRDVGIAIEKRIKLLAEKYADLIPMWDVINEFIGANDKLYRFPDDIDVRAWKLANEYFHNDHLIINDFQCFYTREYFLGKKSALYLQIEKLLANGIRVDGIGMQYHLFHNEDMLLTDEPLKITAEHLMKMINTYSALGKDIHISEITIPSYDGRKDYLELQNVLTKNLYKLWFSMEKVKSIVWWNLIDNTAIKVSPNAPFDENYFGGGLLKNDFTKKPAFDTVENLINNEWHTSVTSHTNKKGYAQFCGYNGEYEVTITKGATSVKRKINLTKNNPLIRLILD